MGVQGGMEKQEGGSEGGREGGRDDESHRRKKKNMLGASALIRMHELFK